MHTAVLIKLWKSFVWGIQGRKDKLEFATENKVYLFCDKSREEPIQIVEHKRKRKATQHVLATMSAQQLQAVFQELDYLDDGYEDGLVSHVGLRRIILETPELEADLGPTFTRALLARAEQNIYGRLTFEEFLLLAREVAVYTHGYRQQQQQQQQHQHNHNPSHHHAYVSPFKCSICTGKWICWEKVLYYVTYILELQHPWLFVLQQVAHKMAPKNTVHNAAVKLAIPESEREDRIQYLDQYSCKPPPFFLLAISLSQLGIFVWHVIKLSNMGKTVGPNGPPLIANNTLIFDPNRKYEVWRFITYMFVHSGYFHIAFNLLIQLIIGIPLEMVHRWWRILLIYICGVAAGSLGKILLMVSAHSYKRFIQQLIWV